MHRLACQCCPFALFVHRWHLASCMRGGRSGQKSRCCQQLLLFEEQLSLRQPRRRVPQHCVICAPSSRSHESSCTTASSSSLVKRASFDYVAATGRSTSLSASAASLWTRCDSPDAATGAKISAFHPRCRACGLVTSVGWRPTDAAICPTPTAEGHVRLAGLVTWLRKLCRGRDKL